MEHEDYAGGAALLAAASLALPWFSLQVPQLGEQSLGHVSGWDALGSLHWPVLILALLTGLRGARAIAPVAVLGLIGLVAYRWAVPPSFGDVLSSQLPTGTDPLTSAVATAFADSLSQQAGIVLHASYGLYLAALAAAGAAFAVLRRPPQPRLQAAVT